MKMEKVKISELSDETLISYEGAHYVIKASEFKEKIKKNKELLNKQWYTVECQQWKPYSCYMLENYIENEYNEMYEGWYDVAMDCITKEVVQQIQDILDKAFDNSYVKNYWTTEKEVECD